MKRIVLIVAVLAVVLAGVAMYAGVFSSEPAEGAGATAAGSRGAGGREGRGRDGGAVSVASVAASAAAGTGRR